MTVYQSITELVGNTPLIQVNNYTKYHQLEADILVKLEYFNPNHSVKDRTALALIEAAEKSGQLKPGQTIVEVTSGNTGIGLAAVAAAKGYPLRIYIQDQVSEERFKIIQAFGAELIPLSQEPLVQSVLKETGGDIVAAVKALNEQVFSQDDQLFYTDQFANLANQEIHEKTTGVEIWQDVQGQIDILVATVGTGGTITGVGHYLKGQSPEIEIIAVQPGAHSIATTEHPEIEEITGVHAFLDIPKEWVPKNFDFSIYDQVDCVETDEAYATIQEIAQLEGMLLGVSAGAAIKGACEAAKKPENKGKKIVVIAPDTGLNYLSTNAFKRDDH